MTPLMKHLLMMALSLLMIQLNRLTSYVLKLQHFVQIPTLQNPPLWLRTRDKFCHNMMLGRCQATPQPPAKIL